MNIITSFFLLASLVSWEHDIQIATFTFFHEEEQIRLEVNIDVEDLAEELQIPFDEVEEDVLANYFTDHLRVLINGQKTVLTLRSYQSNGAHINLSLLSSESYQKVSHIVVHNTCLLTLDDQSNVIRFRLYDEERDFLMNQDRQAISVEL